MGEPGSREPLLGRGGVILTAVVGLATVVGGVATDNPVVMLAPVLALAVAFALTKVSLRGPAVVMVFLILALDRSSDHYGLWHTPLYKLGDLLTDASGALTHVKVAGFEVLIIFLLGIWVYRRATGSSLDRAGYVPMPTVVRDLLIIYVGAVVLAEVVSVARGHGLAPWKARYLLHVPLFFLLFQVAFPSPASFRTLAVVTVAAAHVKAIFAYLTVRAGNDGFLPGGGEMEYATNHGDSVLFTMAVLIPLVRMVERPQRRTIVRSALLLPLPLWGIVLNERRLAWAMIIQALGLMFLATPWNLRKRRITKRLLTLVPVMLIYVGIGWNITSGLFAPVQKVRSMLDSQDPSTFWRDVETWNIASSIREESVIGTGLGGEYQEHMKNADITAGYKEYREWPHNTVLGMMLYLGFFAFIPIWLPYLFTIFFAARAYRHSSVPEDRMAALICLGCVVCCTSMAWGDTGAHFDQHKLAAAVSLALSGKLAISTGAWPRRRARVPTRDAIAEPAPA